MVLGNVIKTSCHEISAGRAHGAAMSSSFDSRCRWLLGKKKTPTLCARWAEQWRPQDRGPWRTPYYFDANLTKNLNQILNFKSQLSSIKKSKRHIKM